MKAKSFQNRSGPEHIGLIMLGGNLQRSNLPLNSNYSNHPVQQVSHEAAIQLFKFYLSRHSSRWNLGGHASLAPL